MSFLINSFQFGTPIPTGNLVLYNRFNNSITDETGNHTLSSNGITYANGLYSGAANEAVEFNADTDTITVPDSDLLSFGNSTTDSPFSISFVANIDNLGVFEDSSYAKVFLHKRNPTDAVIGEYQLNTSSALSIPKIQFFLFDNSASASLSATGGTTLVNSTNYHITVTYDGSSTAGGINIYLDGVAETITTGGAGTYTAMENTTQEMTIGRFTSSFPRPLDGRMDGLGIWDIELSAAEVTAIYNKQSAGNEIL